MKSSARTPEPAAGDSGRRAAKRKQPPPTPTHAKSVIDLRVPPPCDAAGFLPMVEAPQLDVEAGHPNVLVEINADVSCGFFEDRLDVTIRGRAVSTAPIQEILLEVGGQTGGTTSYGQSQSVVRCITPAGNMAEQRVFQFNLPRPALNGPEIGSFRIIVRTDQDYSHAECYDVSLNSAQPPQASILAGPTHNGVFAGQTVPPALLYIETAILDQEGRLSVQGWATALAPIKSISLLVDERHVLAATMGQRRDDVAKVHRAYPNSELSGFTLSATLNRPLGTEARVRASLTCSDGLGHSEAIPVRHLHRSVAEGEHALLPTHPTSQLNAGPAARGDNPAAEAPNASQQKSNPAVVEAPQPERSPQAAPAEVAMFCDEAQLDAAGTLFVNGWAICAAGIAQVRVLLDDRDVGLATFGHERADVGKIYPEIPMAHLSGFRFQQRIGERYDGEHTVSVIACGGHGLEARKQLKVAVKEVDASLPSMKRQVEPEPLQAETAEFRFQLDAPALADGMTMETVTGRLGIEGWLLTKSGIASFEVWLGDHLLGDVHYGLARPDVGIAFPSWPNALRSGFGFHCQPRSLRDGEHTVRLLVRANNGVELERSFRTVVKKADAVSDPVSIRRRVLRVETDMILGFLAGMRHQPSFAVFLRQDQPIDVPKLRTTLRALRLQAYPNWTLTILTDNDAAADLTTTIQDLEPRIANRCEIVSSSMRQAWKAPLAQPGQGQAILYTFLLPGDEPGADALLEFALAGGQHPGTDLFYGDEVRVSPVSGEPEAFFKPDFSPDLLLSTNYIGRPWVVTAALLARTGATPASLFAAGEYDLVLRCAEQAHSVHHVAKLLCQRDQVHLDDPVQEEAALTAALDRRGIVGDVLATPIAGTWRSRRALASKGRVSIIIPTCAANSYIKTCIETLRARTSYGNYEIVCVDNIPASRKDWKSWLRENADKVVDIPDAFNWSIFNNRAAAAADGEYLLFLNDDIEIIQDDWLDALVEQAQRPEVGIVGPRLLYRDGKVQHAGMFLAANGTGRHAFRFAAKDDPCYFGLALTQRNVMAVTGACMLVRRQTFEQLGRFDEAHEIINNDLDFCLRAHQAGLLTVYTPYATLIHYELASRAGMKDVFDQEHFHTTWRTTFAAGDPYFNRRLTRHADDYRPDDEPVEWVVPGAPVFQMAEIQSILVVKLDHIGDFVTALPPIRRLRKLFPQARITVLAGPASRAFIALEPCIDEFIPFSFFHARSQLGLRELTEDDYAELAEQLRPYQFDLAIDLRKHPSTRDVLLHTGARFLAGFDYLGQFPFLDVALDWDGDRTLQRKRSHVVDDLLALVNALGHAAEDDRLLMQPGPEPMQLAELPAAVQALFDKPVVAIHPGAGNITKQWPEAHFSALIDLLVERHNVNVMLVGGPDDVLISESLTRSVLHGHAVGIMAGKASLADLPRLLKNCVLYIGNDSGPKHIAAAVGIPTIGIHSGVVDPVEWGPIGPKAVALRRNMTCSPCYLANAEDCPRSLACLRLLEPDLVFETASMMLQATRPLVAVTPCGQVKPKPKPGVALKSAGKMATKRRQAVSEPA